jgi:single-stranded-DNA-specific exonuclease recJ
LNRKWQVNEIDNNEIERIEKNFNISKLVASIIAGKGLKTDEEIEVFLHPRRTDFHNPFLMPDMEKAANRIVEAIKNNEKVAIYGDYDVDGITSSTVLHRFLKDRGLNTNIYIPNRLCEGYGLNAEEIKKIAEEGHTLMITVDCGITGKAEVELAKSLGIDTIVTDHHEPPEELPEAIAVVDCKRKDNKYPFRELAGVGVTFKLTQAISKILNLKEEENLKYLDIVCIGTISDIVPLVDENRTISKLGLMLLNQTKKVGLKVLLESLGYKKIDSTAVSFGIAPRVNACGRMGHERVALELFLTDDVKRARELAKELNDFNTKRQEIEKRIFEEALEQIKNGQEEKNPCIILRKENWHHGVIGIVSSKITEMYFKPSILMAIEGEDCKGSGRSIPGFDIHEALEKCNKNIKQFGGHSMAIGITVESANFEAFKSSVLNYAKEKHIEDIVPVLNIDEKLQLKDITMKDVRDLALLEPFGEANKPPLFQINNVKIETIRTLSEGKHLKMDIKDDNTKFGTIGFNLGSLANEYKIGDKIDIAGYLEINSFGGRDSIQINIKDIK